MLKTFNCGVGFCIIVNKNNVKKVKKHFSKKLSTLQNWFLYQKIHLKLKYLENFNGKKNRNLQFLYLEEAQI